MEKRWNVYHGNDYLGLKTAREIRESLRQGSLDPFDKVSLENSNIREDLIDVDEIFKESNTQTSGTPHEAPADKRAPEETMYAPRNIAQAAAKKNINPPTAQAYARPSQAAVEEGARGDNSGRGNSTKRYYLISKEKVIGPLNALEIQSLFNRNMLNKNVRVQKIGNEKTIPITQFIASYSGDRLKELAEDGHIPQQIGVGSPSSKVMNELARMASSRRVAEGRRNQSYLLMTIAGLILGALVYLIYERSTQDRSDRKGVSSEEPASRPNTSSSSKPSKITRPRLVQKTPELPEPNTQEDPPKTTPIKEPPVKEPLVQAPLKVQRNPIPNNPRRRAVVEEKSRAIRPGSSERLRKPAAAPPPLAKVAIQNPEPRSTDTLPQTQGPIAKAAGLAGRIQTIGPLSFNMAALDACASKCTLILKDTTSASIRAVFFKNAYYDQLKGRSKGAFLTGNTKIDRGELTIFIQDVR